jgi:Leucine-rich repeat (LRR) protein
LLPHISKLEVSDNRLKELGFLAKNSLFYLNVSGNQIASIDLRDFDFSSLKYINLSKNLIQSIRLFSCNLKKLETMLVYRNKLNIFDFCQAQLPALQLLHLDNNRISDVGNFNQSPLP